MNKIQILEAGWKHHYDDFSFGIYYRTDVELSHSIEDVISTFLTADYDYKSHYLHIKQEISFKDYSEQHITHFSGYCETVEDLKTIHRLLKIPLK